MHLLKGRWKNTLLAVGGLGSRLGERVGLYYKLYRLLSGEGEETKTKAKDKAKYKYFDNNKDKEENNGYNNKTTGNPLEEQVGLKALV